MPLLRKIRFPRLSEEQSTFLVGSGISIPSGLPSGMWFSREIARLLVSDRKEADELSNLLVLADADRGGMRVRFEQLVAIFRDTIDPGLRILDIFDSSTSPNPVHFFLANALGRRASVFTTNFDALIELAHERVRTARSLPTARLAVACIDSNSRALPGCSFEELSASRRPVLFKLHGTLSLLGRPTGRSASLQASVGATLDQIGSRDSRLRLELHKHKTLVDRAAGKTVVVLGYSGLDDFDVGPSLAEAVAGSKHLVWIVHANSRIRILRKTEGTIPAAIATAVRAKGVRLTVVRGRTPQVMGRLFQSGAVSAPMGAITFATVGHGLTLKPAEKRLIVGQIFHHVSDYGRALRAYRRARRIVGPKRDRMRLAEILELECSALFELGRLDAAQKANDRACRIYQRAKAQRNLASARLESARILFRIGNGKDAFELCKSTRSVLVKTGNPDEAARALILESDILKSLGRIAQAVAAAQEAGKLSRQARYRRGAGDANLALSKLYREVGQLAKAAACAREAQSGFERLGHLAPLGAAGILEGNLRLKTGELSLAFSAYQRALDIFVQIGRAKSVATATANIGIIYRLRGQHTRAFRMFKRALKLNEAAKNSEGVARDCENIALYHVEKKQWGDADHWFARSATINRGIPDFEKLAISLNNRADSLIRQGRLDEATPLVAEALSINRKLKRPLGIASSLNNRAELALRAGRVGQARRAAEESFHLAQKGRYIEVLADAGELCAKIAMRASDSRRALHFLRTTINDYRKSGDIRRLRILRRRAAKYVARRFSGP